LIESLDTLYFLDKDGDISRTPIASRGEKKTAK
jgi:hypothetical protein